METLRDMGLEDRLMREATPWELMGNTTFCTSLAGEELGRIPSWGTDTGRHADYELQSPCTMLDAPQTITEPIMVQAAQERGAKVRFDTEYLCHTQDDDGVTTLVRDRLTGADYAIRSSYLIGADGARSKVAADLDLPFEGPGAVGGAMSIIFEADLSRFVDSPAVGPVLDAAAGRREGRRRPRRAADDQAVARVDADVGLRGGRRAARASPTSSSASWPCSWSAPTTSRCG